MNIGSRAVRDLRAARRHRHIDDLDVMEVLYRVYVGAIFGAWGLALFAGVIADSHVDAQGVTRIARDGPALLGLGIALMLFAALRSGAKGGPLAIEAADIQHVFLAPVDRGWVLRGLGLRQLRTAVFAGVIAGLIIANFAFRRLPGSPVEWFVCLALFGGLVAVWILVTAMLASGMRLRLYAANLIGLGLLGWSVLDYLGGTATSPPTMLGNLAILPLQGESSKSLSFIGVIAVAATVFAGLRVLGGLSLEAAQRRAGLVAELRFAATMQDIRTVVLLRRQLASERARTRPWLRLGPSIPPRQPVLRRGAQSYLRWPAPRIGRVALVGVAAGLILGAAWGGTTPLFALAGLILLIAGLDVVEPLAQEVDHPSRRDLLPIRPSVLIRRHLVAPTAVMVPVGLAAVLAATTLGASGLALGVGAVMLVPTALLIVCCAALSATNDPYAFILTPGIGYAQTGLPVVMAAVGVGGPAWAAREAARHDHSAVAAALGVELSLLIGCAAAIWWLGRRVAKRVAVQP